MHFTRLAHLTYFRLKGQNPPLSIAKTWLENEGTTDWSISRILARNCVGDFTAGSATKKLVDMINDNKSRPLWAKKRKAHTFQPRCHSCFWVSHTPLEDQPKGRWTLRRGKRLPSSLVRLSWFCFKLTQFQSLQGRRTDQTTMPRILNKAHIVEIVYWCVNIAFQPNGVFAYTVENQESSAEPSLKARRIWPQASAWPSASGVTLTPL